MKKLAEWKNTIIFFVIIALALWLSPVVIGFFAMILQGGHP